MSDNQYDDLLNDDTEVTEVPQDNAQTPKALREYAKELKKAKEAAEAELNKLRAEQRTSAIETAVNAAGFPPAAVRLAAAEVKDPAEIEAWLESNRKEFGVPDRVESTAPSGTPSVDANLAQNIQRMQDVQPGQFNPTGTEALNANLDAASSKDDFYARLRAMNMVNG